MSTPTSSRRTATRAAVTVLSAMMTVAIVLTVTTTTTTCSVDAFTVSRWTSPNMMMKGRNVKNQMFIRQMSSSNDEDPPALTVISDPMADALEQEEEEEEMDEEQRKQLAKIKRAQELREQEVFMKKSTGIHKCTNCDWEYDETKGDSMMIGGMIKPGTEFADLPADWRCPVCRASKDAFTEVVEEIPGFEVNQGYGFGTNAWTAGQKNLAIFGGLGLFFILFLSGYAMS